jgi:hypothetical protein
MRRRWAASLYPHRAFSALPWEQGGMRFPDLHATVIALQSSVVSRLLRPRQAAWKVLFVQWLGRPREWVEAHPDVPPRDIDCWGMGLGGIFCTQQLPLHTAADEGMVGGIPARVRSYIRVSSPAPAQSGPRHLIRGGHGGASFLQCGHHGPSGAAPRLRRLAPVR